jgi:hypothetical protein
MDGRIAEGFLMRWRSLLVGLCSAMPIAVTAAPEVIHGEASASTNAFGAVYEIESDVGQIRLSPSLVATAAKGTVLEVYAPIFGDDTGFIRVTRGNVALIDERSDRAQTIATGGRIAYDTTPAPIAGENGPVESPAIAAPRELEEATTQWQLLESRQGFVLSDSVMTRQQEYLASLKVDITDLNRVLASFVRRLLFR